MEVSGTVRTTLRYLWGGFIRPWTMGYACLLDEPQTQTELDQVHADSLVFWQDVANRDWLNNGCFFVGAETKPMAPSEGLLGRITDGISTPGTDSSGNAMPAGVALCATMRTGEAGRRRRGRMYFGGLTNRTGSGAGGPPAAYLTQINQTLADLITLFDFVSSPGLLVVPSRTGGFATPVVTAGVDNEWDYQRRRALKA